MGTNVWDYAGRQTEWVETGRDFPGLHTWQMRIVSPKPIPKEGLLSSVHAFPYYPPLQYAHNLALSVGFFKAKYG